MAVTSSSRPTSTSTTKRGSRCSGKTKIGPKPRSRKSANTLAKTFRCVFCQTDGAVSVTIDKKKRSGHLHCRECGQKFDVAGTTNLTAHVDVYCEWIDACEAVAKMAGKK